MLNSDNAGKAAGHVFHGNNKVLLFYRINLPTYTTTLGDALEYRTSSHTHTHGISDIDRV